MKEDSFHVRLIRSGGFELFYPDYGMKEINKYREHIISKRTRRGDRLALDYSLKLILEFVQVIPAELYSQRLSEAYDLMKKIDEKDTPFLALAMQLSCPIWSNDNHFKEQQVIEVYTTSEIVEMGSWDEEDL